MPAASSPGGDNLGAEELLEKEPAVLVVRFGEDRGQKFLQMLLYTLIVRRNCNIEEQFYSVVS
jgi:hypothetical protein